MESQKQKEVDKSDVEKCSSDAGGAEITWTRFGVCDDIDAER